MIELEETFMEFKKLVGEKQFKELYEPIVDIILIYSQSTYKLAQCCIDHIIPIFTTILDNLKESNAEVELPQAP